MPIISPTAISPHRIGGKSWRTYWATPNLALEGHSFVAASGTNRFDEYSIQNVLPTTFFNSGVSGSGIADAVSRAAVLDGKIVTGATNILVTWLGYPDVKNTAGSSTTAYNAFKAYVDARVAAGWKIFAFTVTPTTFYNAQGEIERGLYNEKLKTELASDDIIILDTDTVSELTDATNATYFGDGLHPTNAANVLAMTLLAAALTNKYPTRHTDITITSPASTWTITPTGTGAVLMTFQVRAATWGYMKLTGGAKFYDNSVGTVNEQTIAVIVNHSAVEKTVYIKCTSGSSTLDINLDITYLVTAGTTNAPSIAGDISQLSECTQITVGGNNTLSGSISGLTKLVTEFKVFGNNTISGSVDGLTLLKAIDLRGSTTVGGSLNNLASIEADLQFRGANTVTADFGLNDLSSNPSVIYIQPSQIVTYTGGATWANIAVRISAAAGYGLDVTEVSNIIIDMNNSASGPSSKTITLNNGNALMADTAQGGIWGNFDGETSPSALATAYKNMIRVRGNTISLYGIAVPGVSGDGTGFPAGFGDWYRS